MLSIALTICSANSRFPPSRATSNTSAILLDATQRSLVRCHGGAAYGVDHDVDFIAFLEGV
ncbi:hypothetical protein ACH51_20680 (plasmid) [Ralstonia solanacearum]|nr:hypothetical protein ACH51_20680 [Ralstonia solanacearum]